MKVGSRLQRTFQLDVGDAVSILAPLRWASRHDLCRSRRRRPRGVGARSWALINMASFVDDRRHDICDDAVMPGNKMRGFCRSKRLYRLPLAPAFSLDGFTMPATRHGNEKLFNHSRHCGSMNGGDNAPWGDNVSDVLMTSIMPPTRTHRHLSCVLCLQS